MEGRTNVRCITAVIVQAIFVGHIWSDVNVCIMGAKTKKLSLSMPLKLSSIPSIEPLRDIAFELRRSRIRLSHEKIVFCRQSEPLEVPMLSSRRFEDKPSRKNDLMRNGGKTRVWGGLWEDTPSQPECRIYDNWSTKDVRRVRRGRQF